MSERIRKKERERTRENERARNREKETEGTTSCLARSVFPRIFECITETSYSLGSLTPYIEGLALRHARKYEDQGRIHTCMLGVKKASPKDSENPRSPAGERI